MSTFSYRRITGLLILLGVSTTALPAGPDVPVVGMQELYRLDWLPGINSSMVGSVSSYDRTGGNDDGFSGTYSFIRKEAGGLVLADLQGPGCIYRIWTPTPTDDLLEFYFDGESTPRIQVSFRGMFTGDHPPFLSPIAGSGAGGFYSYVPLPFQKSCRVLLKADKVQFYQINYALYPQSSAIETWQPMTDQDAHLIKARELWGSAGTDISSFSSPPGAALRTLSCRKILSPGSAVELFAVSQPGRIAGLRLGPADALAGKMRSVVLKIYWDGETNPAVICPAGDFFGASWGDPAVQSLLVGVRDNVNYCYLPMPFDRSARIELVSQTDSGSDFEVRAELVLSDTPRARHEGRFYAVWHRENPTASGVPFTFLNVRGQGKLVGCMLQAQGMAPGFTPFFEGDDQTIIDGKPAIHGTGSEDFFNGGWYDVPDRWESRSSFPMSGCLDYKKHLGRSAGYRFMLADAYVYHESILQTIEHGPEKNAVPTDYCAVTYFYSLNPPDPAPVLPEPEKRAVVDFAEFKFTPGWNIPIHAFSFQNVTLSKKNETVDGSEVRFLSLQVQGQDIFGPPFVAFEFDIPQDGQYAVGLEVLFGPDQGVVQMFRNENALGEMQDLYSAERHRSAELEMGTLFLQSGVNVLYFKVMGANPAATGLGFEPVTFVFRRVE